MDKKVKLTGEDFNHACFLVGRFMYEWALLESAINGGVGKLLGMDAVEETIATNNMQFRNKANILKTVIDLRGGGDDWAKAAHKDIEKICDLSLDRNIVAHTIFGPTEDGKVRFLVVKASDKLKFPETVWSPEDFVARYKKMKIYRGRVEEIISVLAKRKIGLGGMFGAWTQLANQLPPGQDHGNYLGRLLLGNPDSPTPTSEEAPQTPQEPEKK